MKGKLITLILNSHHRFFIRDEPLYGMFGHETPITSVAISKEWSVIVTGSVDGCLMIHHLNVFRNETRNVIQHDSTITLTKVGPDGSIFVYCKTPKTLYRYTINGDLAATTTLSLDGKDDMVDILFPSSGRFVITIGGEKAVFRRIFDLVSVHELHVSCSWKEKILISRL